MDKNVWKTTNVRKIKMSSKILFHKNFAKKIMYFMVSECGKFP